MVCIEWDADDRSFVLRSSVVLPRLRESVFQFFSDAFQLEQITPAWLNFQILTPAPIEIQPGCLIDYSIRLHGIPIRWRTEISSWDPPYSFTDRQLKGPYRLWEHLHTFESVPEGTVVIDEVRYRVFGGAIVNSLFVRRELERIFEFRQQRMLQLFSNASSIVNQNQMVTK